MIPLNSDAAAANQPDGYSMLSETERKLCTELQLTPQHYLLIKERLVRESYTRGFLQPGQAPQLIQIGEPFA